MKDRPKVLRAFLEASYTGWRDVMEDPKSALEIFKKRVPEIDLSLIEPNMKMGLDLMKTDRYAKNGIGWMEEKKMCQSVDLVNTYMGVPTKVECKAVPTAPDAWEGPSTGKMLGHPLPAPDPPPEDRVHDGYAPLSLQRRQACAPRGQTPVPNPPAVRTVAPSPRCPAE